MESSIRRRRIVCCLVFVPIGCAQPAAEATAPLGNPIPGLTRTELERFRQGEALFNHVFTPEQGVGPLFNEDQCSACHTKPATGGTGEQFLEKATRFTPEGCDLLTSDGGDNVRTRATPLLRAHGIERQAFPDQATERGRFNVPFVFGLGLIELIPEEDILRRADPDDTNGDGISGRPGRDVHGRLARFGRKGETATIAAFIETALRFEMGLTTPGHPAEGTMGGVPYPPDIDPAPDPEIEQHTIDLLHDFVRFLAPPDRTSYPDPARQAAAARGERLFETIGCTSCHVPEMTTGRSDVVALDRKRIRLYSDLLLHDLGPEFSTVCGHGATPTELRTAMLMGLRHRRLFLHDSRTTDLTQAILLHGGEASSVIERFRSLNRLQQEDLLLFLGTL